MKKNIALIGCGSGLIYSVDIIEKQGLYNIVGLIDSVKDVGTELYGYKVIGRQAEILKLKEEYLIDGAVITLGDNYLRYKISTEINEKLRGEDWEWVNAIHPSVLIGDNVELGKGCLFMANVVINSGSIIGNFVHGYTGAIIEHNNTFESFSSISAGSVTGGFVNLGRFSAITLGCTVFDRVNIGENSIIGSGSLVTKDIPDNQLRYGNPAKFIRNRNLGEKYLK
jgi:sugar O-acyltransferase (sialic acid O-acetyltransferase NeuD family)